MCRIERVERTEGRKSAKGRLADKGICGEDEMEPAEGKGRADGEDELETTNLDKGNDSNELNHVSTKRMRR